MKTIITIAAGVILLSGVAAVTPAAALPASGTAMDARTIAASEQVQPVHMRRHRHHRHHAHRRYRVNPYYGYGYGYAPPVIIPFGFGHHGGHHFGGHGGHHGHH